MEDLGKKYGKGKALLIVLLVLNILLYSLPVVSSPVRNSFLSMGWWIGKLILFIPIFEGYIWARNIEIAASVIDIAFAMIWLFPGRVGEIYAADIVTAGCFFFCAAVNLVTIFMLAKSSAVQDYLYVKRNK